MEQILIDFPGGAHGNFLEFLLNKFYYSEDWPDPFTSTGSSHRKPYDPGHVKFHANHFARTQVGKTEYVVNTLNNNNNVIMVTIDPNSDNILLLVINMLWRGGDDQIDIESIEHNTYNKFSAPDKRQYISELIKRRNLQCSETNPDLAREIIRDEFKFMFKDHNNNGYYLEQLRAEQLLKDKNVYRFPHSAFLNYDMLLVEINNIALHYGVKLNVDPGDLLRIHTAFMSQLTHVNDKAVCDSIIDAIVNSVDITIPKLNVLQEAYIDATLERVYNITTPIEWPI